MQINWDQSRWGIDQIPSVVVCDYHPAGWIPPFVKKVRHGALAFKPSRDLSRRGRCALDEWLTDDQRHTRLAAGHADQSNVVPEKFIHPKNVANVASDVDPGAKCGRQRDLDDEAAFPGDINVVLGGSSDSAEFAYFAGDGLGIEQPTRRLGPLV